MKKTLLIRADASLQIGFGHVLRCLALAQAWQDAGGDAVFVCAQVPEMLEARLAAENCSLRCIASEIGSLDDAAQTQKIALACGATWVVCDGYQFGGDWLCALKCDDFSLLAIDDFSQVDLSAANAILNPNAGATTEFYARFTPQTQVLAGAEFALLRREFRLQKRTEKVISEKLERVLVTMGGGDLGELTPRALHWLQSQGFRGEVVVLSGARQFDLPKFDFNLKMVRAQNEVPEWMKWCDLALVAAGSTTWELACCGTPAILSIVADNQRALALWSDENGIALNVGEADGDWEWRLGKAWQTLQNPTARREMSAHARGAINGQGAARVVQKMWPDALQWRSATLDDARLLWEWRNDAQTRAMSLQSDPIAWETHLLWLETRLGNENAALWMAQKKGDLIGNVRFERSGNVATISIVVAPEWRGRGLGSALIERACYLLWKFWDVIQIRALIKRENMASRRAFENAGFCYRTEDSSMPYLDFMLERCA